MKIMRHEREIIPGETIPLNRFSDEFKARALAVRLRALEQNLPSPPDIEQVLSAPPEHLWVIQLRDKFTYKDLDKIIEKMAEGL